MPWFTVTEAVPPGGPDGAIAVIVVPLVTTTLVAVPVGGVAGVLLKMTVVTAVISVAVHVPGMKPVPLIVTAVPPWLLPDDGTTVVTVATASADGVNTGSVSARIIRRADPNLTNLRLNMCSPL